MTNKVEDKREHKIANAVKSDNWSEVDKLLSQAMDNLERKERYYGKTSLNASVSNEGQATELMNLYPDNTYNPIEQLLIKERNEHLYNVLSKLPEVDLYIFLEITLYGTSELQLTKETPYKSHKTIKKHYEDTIDVLKEELGKYF